MSNDHFFDGAEIIEGQKVVLLCKEEDKESFEKAFGHVEWTKVYSDGGWAWQGVVDFSERMK